MLVKERHLGSHETSTYVPVVIDIVPSSEQAEAARRWQELERKTNNVGLTNSWNWIKTWLEYHNDVIQYVFAFGQHNNSTIGAVLIILAKYKKRGIPIARIHLGTGKYVEYNRLLVVPEYLDSFAVELMKTVQKRLHWVELHFDGFVPEHANALIQATKNIDISVEVNVRKSPIFDFQKANDEGYQDILSALGKNTRYHIRRSLRLFENTYGPLKVEWAETPQQAKEMLRELIDLHQKRWTLVKQRTGAFNKPYLRSYFAAMIDTLKLWPAGSLIICRVKAGETTLGCIYHYVENGHVMFTKGGIAQFEDAKMKPGLVAHLLCMEECRRRGLLEERRGNVGLLKYDFLAGDEPYKDSLTNEEGHLVWATAERGPILWLMKRARIAKKMLKRSYNASIESSVP